MASAAISNSGMAAWLKSLSNAGLPTLASELASPTVQSALQNAPSEVVQLSSEALRFQEMQALFGSPVTAEPLGGVLTLAEAALSPSSLLQTVAASAVGASPSDASLLSSGATPTDMAGQISSYDAALQAQQLQSLFALNPPDGSDSNTLNLLA